MKLKKSFASKSNALASSAANKFKPVHPLDSRKNAFFPKTYTFFEIFLKVGLFSPYTLG